MTTLGWTGDDGAPSVTLLRDAVAGEMYGDTEDKRPRWQTVQSWVRGDTVPGVRYQKPLAQVLGVTLHELAGIALGIEPKSEGWRLFRESRIGSQATDEEVRLLAAHVAPEGGQLSASYYRTALLNLRANVEPVDTSGVYAAD